MAHKTLPFRRGQTTQRVYSEAQLQFIVREENKRILNKVVKDYSSVIVIVLQDLLGFKKKRVERFINRLNEVFGHIHKGLITVEDVQETIKEELKVEVI